MAPDVLFPLAFYVAAPFWLLMIVAPGWSWTRRIAGSPLIVLPVLVVWLLVALPVFGELVALVTGPTLAGLQAFVATPAGAAAVWAQIIGWDLFLGRWIYLDSRARRAHPLAMAPVLVLTVLLSPVGLPAYLALRRPLTRAPREPALLSK